MHREQALQAAVMKNWFLLKTESRLEKATSEWIKPSQKEETYQVILDIIKNTPCYNAFLITADVPEIYMQQLWFTDKKDKKSSFYQFDLDNKTCQIDFEQFREILGIISRVPNQEFTGIFHKENVDYVALIWEDLQCQIDNRQSKRQGSHQNTVDNDGVLDSLKFISKGEIHHVYGKSIPDTLITDEIKISEAYKIFIFLSKGLIPPKIGRGKGAQGTKATIASKKKLAKKNESSDEESDEQEERIIRRKP
ncbi:hypothetical protein Tco_0554005 [Tanacetum coccineum]